MNNINIIFWLFFCSSYISFAQNKNSVPKGEIDVNFVPDSTTAIKIAEAVWLPIYGKAIEKNKPYNARLKNDSTWRVKSHSPYMNGDKYILEINKKNGHIYYVTHEK